jgi:tRNA pseudouridine38-40 synthase
MTRFRATLAYDGTAYQGFQRQADGIPTIQGEVEQAIAEITQQTTTVVGAGRTDTGVHATGQVIAFEAEWKHEDIDLLHALNAALPDDIALQNITQHEGFHPRFDAVSRIYKYTVAIMQHRHPLLRHRVWQIRNLPFSEAMQAAAELLLGKHDFASFGKPPQGENTIRMVFKSEWHAHQPTEDQPFETWTYMVEANAFLQHMVRRIVGALVDVGQGRCTIDEFRAASERARLMEKGTIAPPHGLVLVKVNYPEQVAQDREYAGETPAGGSSHG